MPIFQKRTTIPVGRGALWAFHVNPGAFVRLIPPWQNVSVASAEGTFANLRVKLVLKLGPLRKAWIAQHEGYVEGERFVDRQVTGPFGRWVHTHTVEDAASPEHRPEDGSVLDDRIEYAAPGGAIGQMLLGGKLASDIGRIFAFRHARTRMDCVRHARFAGEPRLRVGVAGSSGLIGRELCAYLANAGHRVDRIARAGAEMQPWAGMPTGVLRVTNGKFAYLQMANKTGEAQGDWEGLDAVVHLGGVNLASGRWSARRKREIVASRVESTGAIARQLAGMKRKPRVLVVASGTGGYRERDASAPAAVETEELDDSFLGEVVRSWEASARPAVEAGIRVVFVRLGIVLSAKGGALGALGRAAKLGGAGAIGGGQQRWSWVSMDDAVGAIEHVLHTESLNGA
ncbi:MAG: NAD-dependent epimerase/dehydratase family protein, partial [Phycisphaerales bacterium]|nr:NAD-dependent epimerase/dehydratase family protein [Phycisphaerales bacterium]